MGHPKFYVFYANHASARYWMNGKLVCKNTYFLDTFLNLFKYFDELSKSYFL